MSETIDGNGDTVATIEVERGTEALGAVQVRVPITGASGTIECAAVDTTVPALCHGRDGDAVLGVAYVVSGALPSDFTIDSFVVPAGASTGSPEVVGAYRPDRSPIMDAGIAQRVAQFDVPDLVDGDLFASVDKTYIRRKFTWRWPEVDDASGYLVKFYDRDTVGAEIKVHRELSDPAAPFRGTAVDVVVTRNGTASESCAEVQAVLESGGLLSVQEECVSILDDGNANCRYEGLSVGDALVIAQFSVGLHDENDPTYCFDQADFNNDGRRDIGDALSGRSVLCRQHSLSTRCRNRASRPMRTPSVVPMILARFLSRSVTLRRPTEPSPSTSQKGSTIKP